MRGPRIFRSLFRLVLPVLIASLAHAGASTAAAQHRRVGVDRLGGPHGTRLREALREALEARGHRVIDAVTVRRARRRRAARGGARLARGLEADAVLTGRVLRRGPRLVAQLGLHTPDRARPRWLGVRRAGIDELASAILDRVAVFVEGLEEAPGRAEPEASVEVEASTPPPAIRPEAERPARPDEDSRIEADPHAIDEFFSLDLRVSAIGRSLSYRDDLFDRVRGYRLRGAPEASLSFVLHPLNALEVPGLRNLRLDGAFERAFGAESRRDDGALFPTESDGLRLGVGYRQPIGVHRLWATVGIHLRRFWIAPSGPSDPMNDPLPELPKVSYRSLRLAIGARLAITSGWNASAELALLLPRSLGGIESELWFPNAEATGLEARVEVAHRWNRGVSAFVDFRLERYGLRLHPEVGDAYPVGGALDRFLHYGGGLRFHY